MTIMKHMKKVFLVLTAVLVLTIPIGVFAATSNSDVATNLRGLCGFGIDSANLTQEQKENLDAACSEITQIKKDSVNQMVQDGQITQEQGNQALERLDEMTAYHEENGYGTGMMNGTGSCQGTMGNGQHGGGMHCGN